MASNNIARLGVILGLDTAEFTASIDKAVSENRKLGREMERSTKKAMEDAQNLKYATEDYGKTLTKVQELERNIAAGRYQGAQQGAMDELRKRATAYDAIAVSATKVAKVTDGTMMNQQQKMQLMYQSTDFFTQVISGQNVMIAAIQQGGQLKDSMGGLGNMFRMLGTILTPVRLALIGTAAVFGTLAFQMYKGRKEFDDLNNSMALTGNYSKITQSSFAAMASELSSTSKASITDAKVIFSEMVKSGKFTVDTFYSVSQAIEKYAQLSGLSRQEAATKLIPSLDGTASSARKLNNEFNFLTIEEYKHIESLAAHGKKAQAIIETSDLLTKSWKNQEKELGLLDKTMSSFGKTWDNFWDKIRSVGKPDSTDVQIVAISKLIAGVKANIAEKEKDDPVRWAVKIAEGNKYISDLETKLNALIEKGRAEVEAFEKTKDDKTKIDDYADTGGADKTRTNAAALAKIRADIEYESKIATATESQKIDLNAAKKTAELIAEFNGKSDQEKRARAEENDALIFARQQQILAERTRKHADLTYKQFWVEMEWQIKAGELQEKEDAAKEAAQLKFLDTNYDLYKAKEASQNLAMQELIDKTDMIGLTEVEVKTKMVQLELEKKIADIRSKTDMKPGDIEEGVRLARLTAEGEIGLIKLTDRFQKTKEMSDSIFGNMSNAIDNFVKTGKLSFGDLARSIIQDLIAIQMKASATTILGGLIKSFTNSYTGLTAGDVGAITGVGHAAMGGDISGPTIVGEVGPELFIPRTAGTIIPNNKMSSMGSTTNVTNYNIQAIDTKSFEDRILGSSKAVWAANAYGAKSLALGRGRT